MGARSDLGVPLLRDGTVIGVLGLGRTDVGQFDEALVELTRSFAEQAVIALHQARLVAEQRETLAQQTATNEVLQAINRSAFDLGTVLQTLVDSAIRLCGAERAILYRFRDGACHFETGSNNTPAYEAYERANPISPGLPTRWSDAPSCGPRSPDRRRHGGSDYGPKVAAGMGNVRSMLGVPLLRDGELAGVFALARMRVEPFSEREIALVSSFATQAAIAMENAQLVDSLRGRTAELQESLDYQTATSEVLQLISRATFDLQPVLQTLVETSRASLRRRNGFILRHEAEEFRAAASVGFSAAFLAFMALHPLRAAVDRSPGASR